MPAPAAVTFEAVAKDPAASKGQKVAWLGSSGGSTETKTADGKVESSVTLYLVEPVGTGSRRYFAVDKRTPVPTSVAAQQIESSKDNRAVLVTGVVLGTVEVPATMVDPFNNDLFKRAEVPLIGQASIDAPVK